MLRNLMLKKILFSCSIGLMIFGISFCTHQQKNRNVSSSKTLSDWVGPKIVQTPTGGFYVYHKVISHEPAKVTYVDVKYICKGSVLKDWKRFKVQWFHGVDKTLSGSVIPLVYDPIAELNLSGGDSAVPEQSDDTKKTVSEEFNLETRCLRDRG